ncbi:MAG: hypothetical protein JOZ97_08480 [Candidatus Eremiobacteraeota bacterium]|nr:hypothetical protein [Candidatus Eremiobacteraeota bacterium]
MRVREREPWFIAYIVAILLLIMLDVGVRLWQPNPARMPELFSPAYLERISQELAAKRNLVLVLGDSVLWGYGVDANDAAMTVLRRDYGNADLVNLAFQGGSPENTYVLLRSLLDRGLHPRLVVFNVNLKEFNPADPSYRKLFPAVEDANRAKFDLDDRRLLQVNPQSRALSALLDQYVGRYWQLYHFRSDIKEAIFGKDDMARWLAARAEDLTGTAARRAAAHRPTPDRFIGSYDLTPLGPSNVAFQYLEKTFTLLKDHHVRAMAFFTPTNHKLLHEFIDTPEYDDNVTAIERLAARYGVPTLNLDRAVPPAEFIDNDHLTVQGNRRLAQLLAPRVRP